MDYQNFQAFMVADERLGEKLAQAQQERALAGLLRRGPAVTHTSHFRGWALVDRGDGYAELYHASTMRPVIKVRAGWEEALATFQGLKDAPPYDGAWDFETMLEVCEARRAFRAIDVGE